jgi:hypothetical protein
VCQRDQRGLGEAELALVVGLRQLVPPAVDIGVREVDQSSPHMPLHHGGYLEQPLPAGAGDAMVSPRARARQRLSRRKRVSRVEPLMMDGTSNRWSL